MSAPLLDTHAWVGWVDHDIRLGRRVLDALDGLGPDERPTIADISLWEVATLVERGRLRFDVPLAEWLAAAAHPRTVRVLPITPEVAAEVASLPESFHLDPADRVIVATARVERLPLLTRDARIRQSKLTRLWSPSA